MNLVISDVPAWFVVAFAFAFGACWGSFFNVAIYRWPRGLSVIKPPSHCPLCRGRIPAYYNVPIVGYLLLRGKTACCRQPLSVRYPIVETLGAVLCVAVFQRFVLAQDPGQPLLEAALIAACEYAFAGGLLIATFVDLEHMEIPDEVSLPGAALGLLTAVYREPGVEAAAIGAGGGYLLIQVLFVWVYEAAFGRRGMGEGDSKLLMMIGAFVGWQGALFALFAGAMQGLVVAVAALASGRKLTPPVQAAEAREGEQPAQGAAESEEPDEPDDPPPAWIGHLKLPFGPFLALGALEFLLFGEHMLDLWHRWMGA